MIGSILSLTDLVIALVDTPDSKNITFGWHRLALSDGKCNTPCVVGLNRVESAAWLSVLDS